MTTLPPYKGFQGAVEYDAGVLFIRLLHITDAVSTTCDAASEVEHAFRELVDDYVETCREIGAEPNRPFKGSFNVRIKPALHRDAAMTAAANEMTLNAWIEQAVREKLERDSITTMSLTELDQSKTARPSTEWVRTDNGNIASLDEAREILRRKRGTA